MRSRLILVAAFLAIVPSLAARADTFQTFNLQNGALESGSAAGTVTIDKTTGVITNENISFFVQGNYFTFNDKPTQGGPTGGNGIYSYSSILTSGTRGVVLFLEFTDTSLVNYAGGNLCSVNGADPNLLCDTTQTSGAGLIGLDLSSGMPVQTDEDTFLNASLSPTPEPSSLALLGTGILGVVGAARRKFRRS